MVMAISQTVVRQGVLNLGHLRLAFDLMLM